MPLSQAEFDRAFPSAVSMVIYRRGQDPLVVDGLRWESPEECYIEKVEAYDSENRLIWTETVEDSFAPDAIIQIPPKPKFTVAKA